MLPPETPNPKDPTGYGEAFIFRPDGEVVNKFTDEVLDVRGRAQAIYPEPMNNETTPPAAMPAATVTSGSATASATVPAALALKTKLGIPCTIIGRAPKLNEVLIKRTNDGAIRIYNIADLQCEGGEKAIRAEIERVCAADREL